MSDHAHAAVFLSYAREDSEVAGRIANALRGCGVEVWFDQSELRGGDVWDQKIRRQIKDCALFVPVISARTQLRGEGYFRLEWKLAVERTYLMADGIPFLAPVVADETADFAAAVPAEFLRVQWFQLPGGLPTPEFVGQVKRLLAAPRTAAPSDGTAPRSASRAVAPPRRRHLPGWAWVLAAAAVGGLATFVVLHFRSEITREAAAAATAQAAPSEAHQLIAKAWALWEKQDDATRDDWMLADQLCEQAVNLAPSDGDAWAARAQVSLAFVIFGFDSSPARYEAARTQAERAERLAPDSNEAQFALANYYRRQGTTRGEGVRILRQLVGRMPDDKRVLRMLASALRGQGQYEESIIYSDRAIALPGGDPIAMFGKEEALRSMGHIAEGEDLIDQVLVIHPSPAGYLKKLLYVLQYHGDLDQARELIEKLPAPFLLEESGAAWACDVWLWRREPQKVLAVANAMPKEYWEKGVISGPKAYFTGVAQLLSGNPEAARTDWQAALQVIEDRLKTQPTSIDLLGWRALLFALLGERAQGEQALRVFQQLVETSTAFVKEINFDKIILIMANLGRRDEAIASLIQDGRPPRPEVRYDPVFDVLHGDPRFDAWLKTAAQKK